MSTFRTRIAPTPSGYLHQGNALNFLITWARARLAQGQVMLRIDDVDQSRVRSEYVQDVFDVLLALRLSWDLGPRTAEEFHASWSQHLRYPRYMDVLQQLRNRGVLFACTCTRAEIRSRRADMRYTGLCLDAGHDFDAPNVAWRLRTPHTLPLPFPILLQKEGSPAYHLASVVDDVDFGITHIVRGADLEPSSLVQKYLASTTPELAPFLNITIEHHTLLVDEQGKKLSKSQGALGVFGKVDIGEMRERLIGLAAHALHIHTEDLNRLLRRHQR